jgi:hypothetical protein
MKRTINLILPQAPEPPLIKQLRQLLPLTAAVVSMIFIILFIASLIFLQINNREYDEMVTTANALQKEITGYKNKEGLYLLVYRSAGAIEKILSNAHTHAAFAQEVGKLNGDGIFVTQFALDKPENAQVTFTAASAEKLTTLIQILNQAELDNMISDVATSDLSRTASGIYMVTVNFKADPSLLK